MGDETGSSSMLIPIAIATAEEKVLSTDVYSQVLQQILSYLSPVELCSAALVCSYWREASETKRLWVNICNKHGIYLLDTIETACPLLSTICQRCAPKAHYIGEQLVRKRWITGQGVTSTTRLTGPCKKLKFLGLSTHHVFAGNTCEDDTNVYVFCAVSGEYVKKFVGHTFAVQRFLVSDTGDIAVTLDKETIKVWRVDGAECMHTIQQHNSFQYDCNVLYGSKLASYDGGRVKICVWNMECGRELWQIDPYAPFNCIGSVRFEMDDKYLVYTIYNRMADSEFISLVDVNSGQTLFGFSGPWSQNVARLMLDSGSASLILVLNAAVTIYDTDTGQQRVNELALPDVRWTTDVAITDSKLIVSSSGHDNRAVITVLDLVNCSIINTVYGCTNNAERNERSLHNLTILSNGLVIGSCTDTMNSMPQAESPNLWDLKKLKFVRKLDQHATTGSHWTKASERMLQRVFNGGKSRLMYTKTVFKPAFPFPVSFCEDMQPKNNLRRKSKCVLS